MTDSIRKSEAERCLEMLMKASKNTKSKSFIDLSRKRGRPKKKNTGAVTEVVDLTNSSNSIVENQDANKKIIVVRGRKNILNGLVKISDCFWESIRVSKTRGGRILLQQL
mmetsp:Transcript_11481/g.22941  ORF Transcript_11481/g.22941 Transcript_11481/m.22941 type:complete len:110 (+) Transcript_11481:119-448(+)